MNLTKLSTNQILKSSNLFFIGGAPRSGTTLVQRILNAHPEVYAGPEFDLVPGITNLYAAHKKRIANGRISTLLSNEDAKAAFRQLILTLFSTKTERENVDYFCEKTPSNCLVFQELSELLPDSKMILVLRDPREILQSMMQVANRMRAAGTPPPRFIRGMTHSLQTICQYQTSGLTAARKNKNVCIVHYEDLVAEPKKTVIQLTNFLKLPFSNEMIKLDGKTLESPKNDDGFWYSKKELSTGFITKSKNSSHQQSNFSSYILNKYLDVDHPELMRYKLNQKFSWLTRLLCDLRERTTSKRRHRRNARQEQ